MIARLMILTICMPLYCQQVITKKVIKNSQIAVQIKGFSDGFLRSWAESACNAQTYIEQHPKHQFARELHTLKVLSILQQLESIATCVVSGQDLALIIECTHSDLVQKEVDVLLNQSPFILGLDIIDCRPEDPIDRDENDMREAGGDDWYSLKDNQIVYTTGLAKGVQNDELTALWHAHTQTQE